jgi:ABC-type transport system substrate-binding protein
MCSATRCAICSTAHARLAMKDKEERTKQQEPNEGDENARITTPHGLPPGFSRRRPAQSREAANGGALESSRSMTLHGAIVGPADWNWKQNTTGHSTNSCSRRPLEVEAQRGKHPFYAELAPSDAIRGELAESWEWKDNPLRIEIKLRKGIMFPEAGRDGRRELPPRT